MSGQTQPRHNFKFIHEYMEWIILSFPKEVAINIHDDGKGCKSL